MHTAFLNQKIKRWYVVVFLGVLAACSGKEEAGAPFEAVEWVKVNNAECETKGGYMVAVRNRNTKHKIRIVLDRWFMGVKTADRGHHDLDAMAPPIELGCSHVDGAEQRWELVDARFKSH